MTYFKTDGNSTRNLILGLVVVFAVILGVYFIAKGIFTLLYWLSPFLLVGALLLNYNVVVDYVKMLVKLFKQNAIVGIVAMVLTALAYPFVAAYLFGRAFFASKFSGLLFNKIQEKKEEKSFTEYEEVTEEEEFMEEEFLDLKEIKKEPQGNEYDNLFGQG